MEWKTRITEMLGCKYPIMQGALMGFGNWKFAAAVAKTGAHACLTASVSRTPERLREDIKRLRDATDDLPFSVNMTQFKEQEGYLDVALEEGVHAIETAVLNADEWGKRIKDAGRIWLHKSALVKHAVHAEKLGADAVILVGLEGIGIKNPSQLPTLVTAVKAARELKIPFVIAGGLGDGHGFLAGLGAGADGIMMGSRFMATVECPISDRLKQNMVDLTPDHPELRRRCLADPDPKVYAEVFALRDKMPLTEWVKRLEKVGLKESDWKAPPSEFSKEWVQYFGEMVSMCVGTVDRITTVKELIDGIIEGAEEILRRWEFVKIKE